MLKRVGKLYWFYCSIAQKVNLWQMASASAYNQWPEYGSMYFSSSRVSPRAQVNIYVWQILHLAMTALKHVLFIIPLHLSSLLSRNSFKKKIQSHKHNSTQNFPRVQTLNKGHLSYLQGFKANVQSIQFFYTRKNLDFSECKSHSIFLSILHVPFGYKQSHQTRNVWKLEPCWSLGQVNFFSLCPA